MGHGKGLEVDDLRGSGKVPRRFVGDWVIAVSAGDAGDQLEHGILMESEEVGLIKYQITKIAVDIQSLREIADCKTPIVG